MDKNISDFDVSVVIPAYNAERTIERALDSVKNQTAFSHIREIIVVNDGSNDNTQKIVENYIKTYPEISLKLLNKRNGGVSSARNQGIYNAEAKWIALLDSDDEWILNKLELQYNILEQHPEIDFLGGNHTGQVISILGKKINNLYAPSIRELCIKMFPQTSTVVFKKEIFNEIGGYDETRKYCEDGHFFMRICEKYNYFYHPNQVVVFDGGKRGFGADGLSGNLSGMQNGLRRNYAELYRNKSYGVFFYVFITIYNELKYARRVLISRLNFINRK